MYAVISDVHSNLEALEAVLRDIKSRGIGEIFFLGDAVGYGPDPDRCVEILAEECKILLAGNHDWGVCGLTDVDAFNENARVAIMLTKTVIGPAHLAALGALPVRVDLKERDITLVHATPWEPEKWHYLLHLAEAELNFNNFGTAVCFIGHSHSPVIIEKRRSGELVSSRTAAEMSAGARCIVNVGSVGQPRDGDPRACYALVDGRGVKFVRVSYGLETTQEKMRRAGFPAFLIERLAFGM